MKNTPFEFVPIKDVVYFQEGPGLRNWQYGYSGIPFLNIRTITDQGTIDKSLCQYVKQNEFEGKYEHFLLEEGDFVVSSSGTLGKLAEIRSQDLPLMLNTSVIRFRPLNPEKLDRTYLKWFIKSPLYLRQIQKAATGTAIKNYGSSHLKQMVMPLPPLEEQRRIAAILDQADAVRQKRKQAIALTEELLRSAFMDMFGDPVTNPKGWDVDVIENFGQVITGNTPPRSDITNYGDSIEWIKSDNINSSLHFITKADEWLSCKGRKIARIVPPNSVLVVCIAGSPSSIGRAALTDREVAFNQQINAVIPKPDVNPYFLYSQFFAAQNLVQTESTESMKGMVSKSKFSSIQFIRPPEHKQHEFGNWFLRFHNWSQHLYKDQQLANYLLNSLLQRAFRGELCSD